MGLIFWLLTHIILLFEGKNLKWPKITFQVKIFLGADLSPPGTPRRENMLVLIGLRHFYVIFRQFWLFWSILGHFQHVGYHAYF